MLPVSLQRMRSIVAPARSRRALHPGQPRGDPPQRRRAYALSESSQSRPASCSSGPWASEHPNDPAHPGRWQDASSCSTPRLGSPAATTSTPPAPELQKPGRAPGGGLRHLRPHPLPARASYSATPWSSTPAPPVSPRDPKQRLPALLCCAWTPAKPTSVDLRQLHRTPPATVATALRHRPSVQQWSSGCLTLHPPAPQTLTLGTPARQTPPQSEAPKTAAPPTAGPTAPALSAIREALAAFPPPASCRSSIEAEATSSSRGPGRRRRCSAWADEGRRRSPGTPLRAWEAASVYFRVSAAVLDQLPPSATSSAWAKPAARDLAEPTRPRWPRPTSAPAPRRSPTSRVTQAHDWSRAGARSLYQAAPGSPARSPRSTSTSALCHPAPAARSARRACSSS